MGNTKRARVGRAVSIVGGAVLGVVIGAGLAFASNESDFQHFQETVRQEAAQAEQDNIRHMDQVREQYREQAAQREQIVQERESRNRSYSLVTPYQNGGRPQSCTQSGNSVYCQ
jgi:hypothetical protein